MGFATSECPDVHVHPNRLYSRCIQAVTTRKHKLWVKFIAIFSHDSCVFMLKLIYMRQRGMYDKQTPAGVYAQSDQSLCYSLDYSMIVKTFGVSKLKRRLHSLCWKSHVVAHICDKHQNLMDWLVCFSIRIREKYCKTS